MNANFKTALLAAFVAGSFAAAPSFADGTELKAPLAPQFEGAPSGNAEHEVDTVYIDTLPVTKNSFEAEVKKQYPIEFDVGSLPETLTLALTQGESEPYAFCTLQKEVEQKWVKTGKRTGYFVWKVEYEAEVSQLVQEGAPVIAEEGSCVANSEGYPAVVPNVTAGDVASVYDGETRYNQGTFAPEIDD